MQRVCITNNGTTLSLFTYDNGTDVRLPCSAGDALVDLAADDEAGSVSKSFSHALPCPVVFRNPSVSRHPLFNSRRAIFYVPRILRNIGHTIGDDVLGIFTLYSLFYDAPSSFLPSTVTLIVPGAVVDQVRASQWMRPISDDIRPAEPYQCYQSLLAGTGLLGFEHWNTGVEGQFVNFSFAPHPVHFPIILRQFSRWYVGLFSPPLIQRVFRSVSVAPFRILVLSKSEQHPTLHSVLGLREFAARLRSLLPYVSVEFQIPADNVSVRQQLISIRTASLIISPPGGISMPLIFARPRHTKLLLFPRFQRGLGWLRLEGYFFDCASTWLDVHYVNVEYLWQTSRVKTTADGLHRWPYFFNQSAVAEQVISLI